MLDSACQKEQGKYATMTVHMAIFSYSEKNSRIELEEVTSMVTDMGDGSYDCQKISKYLNK